MGEPPASVAVPAPEPSRRSAGRIAFWAVVWVAAPLLFGVVNYGLGRPFCWDLRNYHFYNAYAFLNARMDFDVAPAQKLNWMIPLLDVPYYLAVRYLSHAPSSVIIGTVHGLNFALLVAVSLAMLRTQPRRWALALSFLIAVAACTSPCFIAQLGSAQHDNVVSLFVLAALALLLWAATAFEGDGSDSARARRPWVLIALAGACIGVGSGLKLTVCAFAVGSAMAMPFLLDTWRRRVAALCLYTFTATLALLAVSGFWMWRLLDAYGNPLFPYFNSLFRSPWAAAVSHNSPRWGPAPGRAYEALAWPILLWQDIRSAEHIDVFDARQPLLYVCLLALALVTVMRLTGWMAAPQRRDPWFVPNPARFLVAFCIVSYLVWLFVFGVYRYILPVELLAPLAILVAVDRIARLPGPWVVAAAIVVATVWWWPRNTPSWGRLPRHQPLVALNLPAIVDPAKTVVVILGRGPMSYLIPYFPEQVRFVRIHGNLQLEPEHLLYQRGRQIVAEHTGQVFIMFSDRHPFDIAAQAADYGLTYDPSRTTRLQNVGWEPIMISEAGRMARDDDSAL